VRRSRLSFPNSYNHVMNKGLKGEIIFQNSDLKKKFLELINKNKNRYGIKVIAYCIMQNHFHLIVKNEKGNLSEFMKKIEGDFGLYYRKYIGGKGYVFITRFKSTLIQEDVYLKTAIVYVLLNPVRAEYTKYIDEYPWSSYNEYFSNSNERITDNNFVESIFGNISQLNKYADNFQNTKLQIKHTKFGDILSEEQYIKITEDLSNRRKYCGTSTLRRLKDKKKENVGKIIRKFEREYHISIKNLTGKDDKSREIRANLLCVLREQTFLTYLEIQRIKPFKKLKISSLANIYARLKVR